MKTKTDIAMLVCNGNNKKVGLIERNGLYENRGDITPPSWCPYNIVK